MQNLDTEATKDVNIVKKSSKNNNEDNFQELEGNKRIDKNGKRSGFLESSMVNGDSKKKTNLVSNDKENGGKEVVENGFAVICLFIFFISIHFVLYYIIVVFSRDSVLEHP